MPNDADHWDDGPEQAESLPKAPGLPGGALIKASPEGAEGYATEPSAAASRAQAAGLQFLVFVRALRFRWRSAFGVAVPCALLVAGAVWHLLPPAPYTAQALLSVSAHPPKGIFPMDADEDFSSFQRTQVQMVKSRFVLDAVLKDPKVAKLRIIKSRHYPRDWLQKQLEADFSIGPEILRIALSGEDPNELATLVNSVVDTYLDKYVRKEDNRRRDRLELLRKYQKAWDADLQRSRAELKKQAADLKEPATATLKEHFAQERLAAAEKELLQYSSELRRVEMELDKQRRKARDLAKLSIPASVIQEAMDRDPVLIQLAARAAELKTIYTSERAARELADVQKRRKARQDILRPEIVQREREKALRDYQEKTAQLEQQADLLKSMEALLNSTIERLGQEIESIPRDVLDAEPLREKIDRAESFTRKIADEAEALKQAVLAPPRITRMEAAEPPRKPGAKGSLYKPALAGFATLGIVLFAFSWWEVQAGRVATADDVTSGIGLRLIGAIPLPAKRVRYRSARPSVAHGTYGDDLLTASVDATCTVLLHLAGREIVRVLMVTSAVPGEGKTTLASHLAVSLARAGRKTVLVDGDLRKPGLARLFNLPSEPGLREFLRGEVWMDQLVRPTPVPHLSLLPTGRWDGSALEALAQERIPVLFESLQNEYDFVVVDSAPVLGAADSLLMARHVHAVLFSVLRGVSRVCIVGAAQERLAMLGVRTLGAVVNGAGFEAHYGGYRYVTADHS